MVFLWMNIIIMVVFFVGYLSNSDNVFLSILLEEIYFFKLGWLKSLFLYTFSATDANIIKVALLPVEVASICGNVDQTKIDNSLDVFSIYHVKWCQVSTWSLVKGGCSENQLAR